ncbi:MULTISPECIES: helicase-exonuclease AddAB subunit AddA [Helcococcus]|uniref:DNA 3'-5' helicase n=2 Tax=Helcococcus bovis TaxID=3153252 RepID=A0ABW9F9D2_9FIRM
MSEIKYTPEQKEGVFLRNKNIIISAQAGAGKTQVLGQRIINLLEEERIDIDKFLIVTFTNKAAAEMKDRIKKTISNRIKEVDTDTKIFLKKQYNKTINAQISTMHAFCIEVLRSYFYKLGINPAFKILTGSSLEVIKWQAMNDVFNELYKNEDSKFYFLLDNFTKKYSDEYIKEILFKLYTFINSQINPFEWLETQIGKYHSKDFYENTEKYNDRKEKMFLYYKTKINELYTRYEKIYDEIISFVNSNDLKIYKDNINSDNNQIVNIRNTSNYEELEKYIDQFSFEKMESITDKKCKKLNISFEDRDYIKNSINEYRDLFKKLVPEIILNVDEDIYYENISKENLESMYMILEKFDKRFKLLKLKKSAMDFSDIEHLTIKLLDDDEVVNELREKFEYIFFDEYQDSNQVQNYIVNKISRETNLFFVGDIKQSIYKFRLADPLIFKERYELYKRDTSVNSAIDLKHNFRSERKLLYFNNFIFNNLMTEEMGDVNYDDESHRLTPGFEKYNDKNSNIELTFIKKNKEDLKDTNVKKEFYDKNPEAIYVAEKIKEMHETGVAYNEIAILARNSTIIPEICENLELLKIPFYSDSTKFSYNDIEMQVFIEILKAIDNDTDDITLLSVLKSTIGDFTDEDLAYIRGDNKDNSFSYCFRNALKDELFIIEHGDIVEKIKNYSSKINKYRELEKNMTISDLAWYVLLDSGHMSYVLSKPYGDKILDNIEIFIREISEFEKDSFQTLNSFINYIDKMIERKLVDRDPGAELSEEDNVVRIMTIHKSKGLEFKNVFLVSLNTKFNEEDLKSNIVLNEKFGISLKNNIKDENEVYTSLNYKQNCELKRRELLSEEVRLLYVALTRATQSLYFVSSSSKDISIDDDYKNLRSYSSWIYSILSKDKISGDYFEREKDSDYFNGKNVEIKLNDEDFVELIKKYSDIKTVDDSGSINVNEDKIVENEIDILLEKIDNSYDASKIDIPYKKTVTEISAKDKNTSSDFKDYEIICQEEKEIEVNGIMANRPKFLLDIPKEEISSLEKGSLYHYIFEMLPIVANLDIDEFLLNLVNDNYISKMELNFIDRSIIENYINSNLFKRLMNSENIFKEKSFTMKYEEKIQDNKNVYLVDGQIDMYFEENGELVIVDFKTNKKIDEEIYKTQLELYRQGLEKATGKKVKEKLIYWIFHNEVSSI